MFMIYAQYKRNVELFYHQIKHHLEDYKNIG